MTNIPAEMAKAEMGISITAIEFTAGGDWDPDDSGTGMYI